MMAGFLFLTVVTVTHTILPWCLISLSDSSPLSAPYEEYYEQHLVDVDCIALYCSAALWTLWNVCYTAYLVWHSRKAYRLFRQNAHDNQIKFDAEHARLMSGRRLKPCASLE